QHGPDDPPAGIDCNYISVRWKGKIQATATGYYQFDFPQGKVDDEAYVYVGDVSESAQPVGENILGGDHPTPTPVDLTDGTLYDIRVDYKQLAPKHAYVQLFWKRQESSTYIALDKKYLYPEGQESLANGTVQTQTVYCDKPDTIQAINHHLIDSFNLVNNQ